VDRVLQWPAVAAQVATQGHAAVVAAVRAELAAWRAATPAARSDETALATAIVRRVEREATPNLRPVFNLTGTVLHTNLGRALLPVEAVAPVVAALTQPVNLEFDLEDGGRGERDSLVESLLCELTGAEAATVVNNNAAAVLLVLAALGRGREAIVSRGELVEIGGAFRMPDVMAAAGTKLREVGTTNRTHARDYADAIGPRTALVMKVHTSNYAIAGFTSAVSDAEAATIAHAQGLPLVVDLGSGSLVDMAAYGLPAEPQVQHVLAAGADVVTFSGDKLLGGPQAGLIVGTRAMLARIRKHPLKRALRVSKLTLAALEATLRVYRDPARLAERLPTLRLLTRKPDAMMPVATRLAPVLARALGPAWCVDVAATQSQIGSGALPVDTLPSVALVVRAEGRKAGAALKRVAAALRALPVPVLGRIADDALWLDLRCLDDEAGFAAQLA
ncbi:MAG: L-seryl-tRNA(Sec) selenium transferase, partial [Proteobacteria bacterium]|nr:L-seryl-tRNA(Sec) selenium transferase [Pseudomonadota bacterium]